MKNVILIGVVILLIIGGLYYAGWKVQRWWHYKWGYESRVEAQVCEMVKPEALQNPEKC